MSLRGTRVYWFALGWFDIAMALASGVEWFQLLYFPLGVAMIGLSVFLTDEELTK